MSVASTLSKYMLNVSYMQREYAKKGQRSYRVSRRQEKIKDSFMVFN